MSTYLAIRGVAETLRRLLKNEMENKVTISFGPPDLRSDTGNPGKGRIILYLYKIVENPFLNNQEIPGQGHPAHYGQPPLSLVLYYLLTPFSDSEKYNDDYDLDAHKILGDAMRIFHDYPILTDSMECPPGSGQLLLHSSLQNQFEKVKITLDTLDTEELTKIWMGLNNPYRLSVGYTISVVQIEGKKPRRLAIPTKTRKIHLTPFHRPQIEKFYVTTADSIVEMPPATARIGDKIILQGNNFSGLSTQVLIGEEKIDVIPKSDRLIEFDILDDSKLQPGPTSIGIYVETPTEIVQGGYTDKGENKIDKNILTSNQMPLMLVPKITGINPTSGNQNVTLTINGERLFKKGFKCFVLVGDFVFEVENSGSTDTKLEVPLKFLKVAAKGHYLIRVKVNGGESLEDNIIFKLI